MEAEKTQDPGAEVQQPDEYTRKIDAIAKKNEKQTALMTQRNLLLAPFSDDRPYNRDELIFEIQRLSRFDVEAIVQIGKRLIVVKEHTKHGEFLACVEEYFSFSIATAERYMLLATRMPKDKLGMFAPLGLQKCYVIMEEASEEELERLSEGDGVNDEELTADRIKGMNSASLRIALRREKEKMRRKQDQIDKGLEQVEKLQKKLDDKVEVDKDYTAVIKKVFNAHMDVEKNIIAMLQLFNAKDALPQTKRAIWSLYNEISARFAYEADLIGIEAGEAVPDLELAHSEERFKNNLNDMEGVYAEGGLDIGEVKTEEATEKKDMETEDGEFVDLGTGEITS